MDCWSTCSIDVAESQTPVAATLVDDKKKKKKKTKTKTKKKKEEEEKEKETETENEKEKEKAKEKKKKKMMTPKVISNRKERYGRLESQF